MSVNEKKKGTTFIGKTGEEERLTFPRNLTEKIANCEIRFCIRYR